MTRFLVINKKERFDIEETLRIFAEASENNPTPDGNWQGDGWGISYVDPYLKWRGYKTFVSIWKCMDFFNIFMPSNIFMMHARTLEAEEQYVSEDHNMPYYNDEISFVFDGVEDEQQINLEDGYFFDKFWGKILQLDQNDFETGLRELCNGITLNKVGLKAANFVISDKKNIYIYSKTENHNNAYYKLKYQINENQIIIASQEYTMEGAELWKDIPDSELKVFPMFEMLTK